MDVPGGVLAEVERLVGHPYDATPLAGLSGATVVEVVGPCGRVVVKGPVGPAERHVTTVLEPALREGGVRIARCLAVVEQPRGPWLVLEHLPRAWPRERWGADPEALAVLCSLHAIDGSLPASVPGRFAPSWDDRLTRRAADLLGVAGLDDLQRRAGRLFEPVTVVSADPNPLNWRLDTDGRACLVDQGRLTLARPELDLAILLPGLPTRADVEEVVAAYGDGDPDLVLLAKLWTVVELVDSPDGKEVARRLAPDLREWCAGVL